MATKLARRYPDIIEHCRTGKTTRQVQDYLEGTGTSVHASYLRKVLTDWSEAGALRDAGGPGKAVYYSTARAMEPSTMVAVLGPAGALSLGVTMESAQPPQVSLRSQALEPSSLTAHTIHDAPQVAQVRPGPLSLFRAEFTTEGLVIPYEEVPGLVAMLDAVMNRER